MALSDKNAYMQVIGTLMRAPYLLKEGVGGSLDENDFDTRLLQSIYIAIRNLQDAGAQKVGVIDIDNYLRGYEPLGTYFKNDNGIVYLQDCEEVAQEDNFEYYCTRVKKFSALRSLEKIGYNIAHIYNEKETDPKKEAEQKEIFDGLTVEGLFELVRGRISKVEYKFTGFSNKEKGSAGDNILELIESLKKSPEIGRPLQGEIFNSMVRGARLGKFYLRSASTGVGKSRGMIGDATFLAYPWRYSLVNKRWESNGGTGQKVLFIPTEMDLEEVRTVILANLSGINETKILCGAYTEEEAERIAFAAKIMIDYKSNFILEQIPEPNLAILKSTVKKNCNMYDIKYVFFDYIFTSTTLLSEFRDIKVREDVALGLLGAALKDLAVELNVFVMSATQLSGDFEDSKRIKTQTLLRGAKSLADKVDVGCIISPVAKEDVVALMPIIQNRGGRTPNQVLDMYKIRRGEGKGLRVWSFMDLSTGRSEDLFVTNHEYEPISMNVVRAVFENEAEFPHLQPKIDEQKENIDLETGEIIPLPTQTSATKKGRFSDLL